ncbi:hypothetical protein ACIP5Y_00100 [Nocardia sp. NPDC088792]|uniref:hypothetical protein n=1 Tax=Nocardia sp. NPDC088792 TaxID=3364332 RepID=UPI0038118C90
MVGGLSSVRGPVGVEAAMVGWREELARRESEAAEQVQRLRGQIAELTEQLGVAEALLSWLAITRETTEILVAAAEHEASEDPEEIVNRAALLPVSVSRPAIGVMLVPQRAPGMDVAQALPQDYGDIVAVLTEAGFDISAL